MAQNVSRLVKATVPNGAIISVMIDIGRDYYKKHQPQVGPMLTR